MLLHGDFERDTPWRAPRVRHELLASFLTALPESIVTRYPEERESLARLIDLSRARLDRSPAFTADARHEVRSSSEVSTILGPMRQWFDVPFYFLPIGGDVGLGTVKESPEYTLWLLCETPEGFAGLDLIDPFPALRAVFTQAERRSPVTVCWNWAGEVAIVPHRAATAQRILGMTQESPPWHFWDDLKRLHKEDGAFNLLQVSDLHFGAGMVNASKVAYVEQHLQQRIYSIRNNGGVVQPVVTGDLMDSPSKKNLAEFEAFRTRLTANANAPAICIPGNHDMRRKGFLWRNWEALAGLRWENVVASEVCKVLFVCFDTSREAKLAQGRITDDQFRDVATKLDGVIGMGRHHDYIRVALVHHHPFSTEADEEETLPFLGLKEEPFLRMDNGEQLVTWCARRNVPLVLHGHKHRPRFIRKAVDVQGEQRLVHAIGCGSSFGIEGKPLSFNWITWQPSTRSWTVSYFADPGDGSGFVERRLAVGTRLDDLPPDQGVQPRSDNPPPHPR